MSGHAKKELHNYITLYIADIYRDAAAIVVDIVRREAGAMHNYGDILVLVNSLRSKHSPAHVPWLICLLPTTFLCMFYATQKIFIPRMQNNRLLLYREMSAKTKVNFLTDCGARACSFEP